MKKKMVKFEKIRMGYYKTTDGVFEIELASHNTYRILKNGKYFSMSHTINDAKQIIRNHIELYMWENIINWIKTFGEEEEE